MNTDLFGNFVEGFSDEEQDLRQYDTDTFSERLKRLRIINKILPHWTQVYGSDESLRIYDEALHSFIFGQYAAAIILAQAFIERRFQEYFSIRFDDQRAKYTLADFLKEFKGTGFLPDYLFERIDNIRLQRNPLTHFKNPNHKNSLMERAIMLNMHPDILIEKDAKDAIEVMFYMVERSVL
jgi:hypothetical protein